MILIRNRSASLLCAGALLAALHGRAQVTEPHADVRVVGHVFKPVQLPPPDLSTLRVPPGFRIERFAENAGNVRMLAIGDDGTVYVTRREQADVLMFQVGPNGLAAGAPRRVAGRAGLHGITIFQGNVYLATVHEIFRGEVLSDGTFGPLEMLVDDLPDAGQHNTRTVQIGPDNMMYVAVGSTCNECTEPNQENAAMLRLSLDGKSRSIFATGLRDTIGWGWHPQTGELWGMDHGIDWLGDNEQPEELNLIENGKRYGWPYVYGDNKINPHADPPGGLTKAEWARSSVPPVLKYTPHSAPMQMSFYAGSQFPPEFMGDAFVSMRGSWNRKPASGYEVIRIRFRDGKPVKAEPFITGFLSNKGESGRLAGNAVAKDGSLLFTDDRNGIIYRVSYAGAPAEKAATPTPSAGPMLRQTRTGEKSSLAIQDPRTKASGTLNVTSPALSAGGVIPQIYSAYSQNVSLPLEWSPGPAGTRSYVLLMEDPDAKITPLPVVHWLLWNMPETRLPEGLTGADQLRISVQARQGINYAGKVGYNGPRPPAGDPPHHYHFQVFALDQELSLLPGASRHDVLQAMEGHVLAKGELVGTFARPQNPPKP